MLFAKEQCLTILHVEDNDDHAEIVRAMAAESLLVESVIRCRDAESALDYLDRGRNCAAYPAPNLILLDLRLPNMTGLEFLARIKSVQLYAAIPVIILSATGTNAAIAEAYSRGAAGFVTKPSNYDQFLIKLAEFHSYWTLTSEVPRPSGKVDAYI